jgi:hypothetical protein
VKILFCALHFGYFRNFESAIAALAERGHHVHLAADEQDALGGEALVERLAARYPTVDYGMAPALDGQPWFSLARKLRLASDFVRFHDEPFTSFRKTRLNLTNQVPRLVRRLTEARAGSSAAGRRALGAVLRRAEALMPISDASLRFIDSHDPDAVLFASVSVWRAPQFDHLRAARALGRRTGICVFSWDHLSSKAFLRIVPDRVFVWNETQKQEAVEWHRLPSERVVMTGAQCYDQWFDRRPSRDRETFCRSLGLAPEHPILLYVCSVMTPDPRESRFVTRWIEEIRRSPDPRLRQAGILVRPHPERRAEWKDVPLDRFGNVALYGRNPITPDAQDDYFDSLYHSHAVAGLVTSAFIEAAVVGRPVLTVLLPEFEIYQEGMQHFRYLLEVGGGVLVVARSFPEHLQQLASALDHPPGRDERNVRFVEAFVRPQGLHAPATPAFAGAVEEMAAAPPLPADPPGRLHAVAQPVVHLVARSAHDGWLRPAFRDTLEMTTETIEEQKAASKRAAVADKAERMAEKQRLLERHRRRRRRERWTTAGRNWRKHVARLKGQVKDFNRQVKDWIGARP